MSPNKPQKTARFGALAIAAVWLAVAGVLVRAGPLVLNDASVTVGLSGLRPDEALLGQAFLKHFDVEIRRDEMFIRQRR